MSGLPLEARRRLSATVTLTGPEPVPFPAIPVTADGWETVLDDAGLVLDGALADTLEAAHVAATSEAPAVIRAATRRLADVTGQVLEDLRLMEAFRPSRDGRTAGAKTSIEQIAREAIEAVAERDVSGQERRLHALAEVVASMARGPEVVDDRLAAIFGSSRAELVDSDGRTSVERIVAMLHRQGRLGEDMLGPILAPITAKAPPGAARIRAALPHLTGPRPLVTLRTAVKVQDLILERMTVDAVGTGAVLRALKLGIERSAASHRGMMRIRAEMARAPAPSDVAYLTLDFYRRFVESQVRPWGWALLQLAGATVRDNVPELGTMREQLAAAQEALLNDWAKPILTAARNAAAHEDFTWDHEASALRAGTDLITIDDLEAAIELGYAMMTGAESGWACARANNRDLARELDAADPPGGIRTLDLASALTRFGTNGLRVHAANWEGAVVVVELDQMSEFEINPCFQAVIESVAWVTAEWFEIRVMGRQDPIMRLATDVVRASRDLWRAALQHFREMPTSVFVPLNVEARLAIEDVETARRAAAWLALDGALMAHREYDRWVPEQAKSVALHLRLAREANELVQLRMPAMGADPFDNATRLIRAAESSAMATAAGLALPDPAESISRLQAAFDALERPLILPTLGI